MALLTVEEHVQDADGTVPGESLTVIGLRAHRVGKGVGKRFLHR